MSDRSLYINSLLQARASIYRVAQSTGVVRKLKEHGIASTFVAQTRQESCDLQPFHRISLPRQGIFGEIGVGFLTNRPFMAGKSSWQGL